MPLRHIAALPTPALCPAPLVFGTRSHPSRFQQQQKRLFHATRGLRDEEIDRATNHYEALKLPTNATPVDIKRSFYGLSKSHHPDHNRSDPAASKRFMRISEAYTTLSSPEKRTRYDRDVLNLHHPHEAHPGRRGGSYSSTSASNPAGGRPASGLSKRRSAFRGPPPASTAAGAGARTARSGPRPTRVLQGVRKEHSRNSNRVVVAAAAAAAMERRHEKEPRKISRGPVQEPPGGMGPGQDPFKGSQDDVPHFDREGHERTGRRTAEARTTRRRMRMDGTYEAEAEAEQGAMSMFFVIGGVILTSFLVPMGVYRIFWGPKTREKKKKKVDA
ncbi:uncharacterized protein PG998_000472 [Apiospora kogelbergensis]|uniref:uncharacterized protein n=1 Tax=Apiospora kogelbergensis TaxID=1337665 RepID=UPI003130B976